MSFGVQNMKYRSIFFFFQAEDGIRVYKVTGVQACALPIWVSRALAWSDSPPQAWTVRLPRDGFVLVLAHQSETGEGVLWMRPAGSGTLIVSGFGSLFSNRALAGADNARLLANIVGASVRSRGALLFDDEHQGLAAAYDPAKFYNDPRLYGTIGVLAAVWLPWGPGGARPRPAAARTPAPPAAGPGGAPRGV